MPAVRQLARPTSTYSTGVAPLSSEAKTSGWSASNLKVFLRRCSSPRPKKLSTVELLCVPFFHSHAARHLNCAACGALVSASRAAIKASTFTPLLTATLALAVAIAASILTRGHHPMVKTSARHKPHGLRPEQTHPCSRGAGTPH